MVRKIPAGWPPVIVLIMAAVLPSAEAQQPRLSGPFLEEVRSTQPGKPVAIRIADPFARPEQERALIKFLNQPKTYEWDKGATIADIGRDIGKHIALQVDHRALEEIGLSANEELFPNQKVVPKRESPSKTPSEDPFAADTPSSPTKILTAKPGEQRWWERQATTTTAQSVTNAALLFQGLDQADLVIATWSGRWLITTQEAAEMNLSTRMYDVTPLADLRNLGSSQYSSGPVHSLRRGGPGASEMSIHELIDVVQIAVDPDTWEALGGPSTSTPVVLNGRTWLVISAPVMTHWKVQALLNQMNGAP